jgi:hypothetical protein
VIRERIHPFHFHGLVIKRPDGATGNGQVLHIAYQGMPDLGSTIELRIESMVIAIPDGEVCIQEPYQFLEVGIGRISSDDGEHGF